jgi:hypothetical protein
MKIEIFIEHHGSMLPFVTFINPVSGEYEFKASGDNIKYKGKAIISETEEEETEAE